MFMNGVRIFIVVVITKGLLLKTQEVSRPGCIMFFEAAVIIQMWIFAIFQIETTIAQVAVTLIMESDWH